MVLKFLCLTGSLFATLSLFATTVAAAQDVTNFKSGRICLNPDSKSEDFGRSEVCLETDEVAIDGQSVCNFNGEKVPCTWFGFEFEFAPRLAGKTLQCAVDSDVTITYGGPKGITNEDSRGHEFELTLPNNSSRFFNPQFAVFRSGLKSTKVHQDETSCKFEGKEVLRYRMRYINPANNLTLSDRDKTK